MCSLGSSACCCCDALTQQCRRFSAVTNALLVTGGTLQTARDDLETLLPVERNWPVGAQTRGGMDLNVGSPGLQPHAVSSCPTTWNTIGRLVCCSLNWFCCKGVLADRCWQSRHSRQIALRGSEARVKDHVQPCTSTCGHACEACLRTLTNPVEPRPVRAFESHPSDHWRRCMTWQREMFKFGTIMLARASRLVLW